MILHNGHNLVRLIRWHLEFIQDVFHALGARMNVIAFVVPVRFADIVKQQRQEQ